MIPHIVLIRIKGMKLVEHLGEHEWNGTRLGDIREYVPTLVCRMFPVINLFGLLDSSAMASLWVLCPMAVCQVVILKREGFYFFVMRSKISLHCCRREWGQMVV